MSSSLESAIARRRPAAGRPARHPYTILPLALAALVGALAGNALAQGSAPAKGSGEHIAAVTKRVDGAFITFALGGTTPMPEFVKYRMDELVAGVTYDPANVKEGTLLYVSNCVFCHGVPGVDRGGNIPNLGYMKPDFIEHLDKFVFDGPASERGMPNFTGKLSPDDVEKIKAFIQGTADAIRPKK